MLKTYFVCLSFLLNITDLVRCEPDYVFNVEAGGWLKLYSAPEAWEEAFLRCHKEGAVLASPLNKELTKALLSKMTQFGVNGHIFLGTHDLHSKGIYVSVEGVPLSDMDIRWGSRRYGVDTGVSDNIFLGTDDFNSEETYADADPGCRSGQYLCIAGVPLSDMDMRWSSSVFDADTGDCLTMYVDGSTYKSSCKEPLPFVCYRRVDNHLTNGCGIDNEYHLNPKTGSCYKVHLEEQAWTRAYEICNNEGGHLVILNDKEEAHIVKDMFPVNTLHLRLQFHIGLRAWGNERIWTTIHGERIEDVFNCWNTTQPDNWYGTQDRATFLKNGYLDDVQPWTVAMFVCEKPPHLGDFSIPV